ncbi:alpha/beta hydrolase [Amycolatopsis saalfeldensis]|uniref:Acetyl esterase/lipase n=1 Tax=Amycolatopsis saalfeldensis TaxID=394193 RepID=A0A1H8VZM2_9PSEU|nr:alpha/beta hydrolase [Amycolatopsis saalfeldensis]SEP20388.1 Acetyl esterase/lipase [Amycolatopsis saalfeldensis]
MRSARLSLGALAVVAALAVAACSGGSTEASPGSSVPSSSTSSSACPSSPAPAGPPGAGPAGAPTPQVKLVVPVDTSTSTVLKPDPAQQIQCGKVQVDTKDNVAFAAPKLADGKTKQLRMDIQVPRTPGPKPLVVYVPGGGFVQADKQGNLPLRTYAADAGFVVASIQYRVQPDGATYTDSIADVKSAIRYLRAHASAYQIDPGKVGVWGDSAGGYLVAMVGVTNGDKRYDIGDNLDQSSDVQAVVDKFGASDLSKLESDYDAASQQAAAGLMTVVGKYVNGPASTQPASATPAAIAAANPITHVKPADPPFVIFHGSADTLISPSQTLMLQNALKAAGVKSTRYVVGGAGHGDLSFTGDTKSALQWTSANVAAPLLDFLNQSLKG